MLVLCEKVLLVSIYICLTCCNPNYSCVKFKFSISRLDAFTFSQISIFICCCLLQLVLKTEGCSPQRDQSLICLILSYL